MKWAEVSKLFKKEKGKGSAIAISKILISGTLQGKHLGIANFVNDLAAFLDYMNVVGLRDMYSSINAQKEILKRGIKSNDPTFTEEWKAIVGMSKSQIDAIEKQVDNEIASMTSIGAPIPRNYKSIRTRELIREGSDSNILAKAHDKAIEAMGMGQPSTAIGSLFYLLIRQVQDIGRPKQNEQMSLAGLGLQSLISPIVLFMRMAIVLGEKSGRYAPFIGPVSNLVPFKFYYDEELKKPRKRRNGIN
jgi:hypothetical protein